MIVWGYFWTGTNMIFNAGGRYDPASNTWATVSMTGAPAVRGYFSAIWTGSRMVIWGGLDPTRFPSTKYNTGGRYDPVADAWSATSLGLSARAAHSAVWTGSRMIVWGGEDPNTNPLNNGGLYDPATDLWAVVSMTGAPSARWGHLAVWTGHEMILWGGSDQTGGRYDPVLNSWSPTPLQGAPPIGPGRYHAVWAGTSMIVWGGGGSKGGVLLGDASPDNDQDGFRVCGGDCDDTRATVRPGAPEICDGLNNDCSSPSWPALPPSERDDDGDGFSECQGDCDDTRAAVHPGVMEVCDLVDNDCDGVVDDGFDQDGDQWTSCGGDCDDTRAFVYPGAPQICGDGLNEDCSSPSWPSLAGTNEADNDGDSLSACAGDCDDTTPETHPGAVEVNDGKDNECPGEPGAGSIDEISGEAGFASAASPDQFCWTAQTGATGYETLRGDDARFTGACNLTLTSSTCRSDSSLPPPGGVLYYLVRARTPHLGSWGQRSSGVERHYSCAGDTSIFTFVDTSDDDIPDMAIQSFLDSLTVSPTDHIFVGLETGMGSGGAWCSERADFYKDRYLTLGPSSGSAASGSWNKWFKTETGPWSPASTSPYFSYFGTSCVSPWSWCVESNTSQLMIVNPSATALCECSTVGPTCGFGVWRLTIRMGVSRALTCGF